MKFNGWLSFFLGLLEFTETLGHYLKLRTIKLNVQIHQLTQPQRLYLRSCLDQTTDLMLEYASKLALPAIEIEKFLKENEHKLNEHQVFFLRSDFIFRRWVANLFKKESQAPHLNDKIKEFLSLNVEDGTDVNADKAVKYEEQILLYCANISKINAEANAFIKSLPYKIYFHNAETSQDFGEIFEEFEANLDSYKTALREDLIPSAKKELDKVSEIADLLYANSNYLDRIASNDENNSVEPTSESDWGQFSSIHNYDSSLIVCKEPHDKLITISNSSIFTHLLLSEEKANIHVKQIYESPRSANFLGLKF